MSTELIPLSTHPAAALPAIGIPQVVAAWLRARNQTPPRLPLGPEHVPGVVGATSTAAAVDALLSAGQASANLMTMNYGPPWSSAAWPARRSPAGWPPCEDVQGFT